MLEKEVVITLAISSFILKHTNTAELSPKVLILHQVCHLPPSAQGKILLGDWWHATTETNDERSSASFPSDLRSLSHVILDA